MAKYTPWDDDLKHTNLQTTFLSFCSDFQVPWLESFTTNNPIHVDRLHDLQASLNANPHSIKQLYKVKTLLDGPAHAGQHPEKPWKISIANKMELRDFRVILPFVKNII